MTKWWVIRILSTGAGVGFQWFGFTLAVDSLHAEHVVLAFLQSANICLRESRLTNLDPPATVDIHAFDDVGLDWLTAIIFRWQPRQFAGLCRDIRHLQWARTLRRFCQHHQFHLNSVCAIFVLSSNFINA